MVLDKEGDYYNVIGTDKKIKQLKENNLLLEIEIKDLKKEINRLNKIYEESI